MFNKILTLLGIRNPSILSILQQDLYESEVAYSLACDKFEEYKAAKAMYKERIKRITDMIIEAEFDSGE